MESAPQLPAMANDSCKVNASECLAGFFCPLQGSGMLFQVKNPAEFFYGLQI
jgi:hypothetical protein